MISVVIMAGFAYFFKYSRMGLAMRATAFDQQVAQSLGISVKQVFAIAWAISSVGVGAGRRRRRPRLWRVGVGRDGRRQGVPGGHRRRPRKSIVGAVLGGLIIGLLEGLAQFVDSEYLHFGNLITIAPFYAMLLILLIKPYGLFGTKNIERV